MKVAIDALDALGNHGIGRYIRSLTHSLIGEYPDDQFIVYGRRRRQAQFEEFAGGRNSQVMNVGLTSNMMGPLFESVVEGMNARLFDRSVQGVDLIHMTGAGSRMSPKAPFIQTVHDLFPIQPEYKTSQNTQGRFKETVLKRIESAAAIITPSQWVADSIREHVPQLDVPIKAIHLAASDEFRPATMTVGERERFGLKSRQYVLYVGRDDYRKNLNRMITAFASLPDTERADVAFVVCTSDPMLEIKEQHKDLIDSGRLIFITGLTTTDLVKVVSNAICLGFASLAEGFGLPVLEAMACGCPVVTSNTTSIPEVAGDSAVCVDPTDTNAIADAFSRLISDSELRTTLKTRGLEHASTFSWKRAARETMDVYKTVLGL